MPVLSQELIDTIKEVQAMKSLQAFALAGGTNLALRYQHRQSIDIDLFSNQMVGLAGLEGIKAEMQALYGERLTYCLLLDPELVAEQYVFLRAFVQKTKDVTIKIEVIHNIPLLDPFEEDKGFRLLSQRDIGLLKLSSVSNRKAKKDAYDLDYITDQIPLDTLLVLLRDKQAAYADDAYRNTFDYDNPPSPIDDIKLLLAFDRTDYTNLPNRPNHSSDLLDIQPGHKHWVVARGSWRRKVVAYMRANGLEPDPVTPIA